MALRDQLLGTGQSIYDRLGSPGSISSFDPFFNRDFLGSPQAIQSSSPLNPPLSPITPNAPMASIPTPTPTKSIPDWFGGPRGQGLEPAGTPQPLRGLASIPKDTLSQLTSADIPELPFNLLTGEISATPQKDMGFVTIHPHAANDWNLPLDFPDSNWQPMPGGGESPVDWNPSTGEIGPHDPGLGSFKSTARSDFSQAGGGKTFDLLNAGLFGNPETAFESLKGFQQDVSSPFDVFGSLLGGALGIAGLPASGFISPIAQALGGFGGLLAQDLSGSSAAGLGTKEGIGLLGLHL